MQLIPKCFFQTVDFCCWSLAMSVFAVDRRVVLFGKEAMSLPRVLNL
jgi:hypothetical protein